jgi:hypothetical protein
MVKNMVYDGICGMVIPASLEIPKELSGYNMIQYMNPDIDGVMTNPLILYGKVNQCFDHVNGVQHPLSFQKKIILVGQLWIFLMDWDNPQYPHLILGSMAL